MSKTLYITIITAFFIITSCTGKELNEKITANKLETKFLESRNNKLLKKWFTPEDPAVNITFYPDRTFIFNKSKDGGAVAVENGTYNLEKNRLTLMKSDGSKEIFEFSEDRQIKDLWYLKNEKHYMVNAE